jgi:hypothetical protein
MVQAIVKDVRGVPTGAPEPEPEPGPHEAITSPQAAAATIARNAPSQLFMKQGLPFDEAPPPRALAYYELIAS